MKQEFRRLDLAPPQGKGLAPLGRTEQEWAELCADQTRRFKAILTNLESQFLQGPGPAV
jgi:hypothetical protein